MGIKTSLCSQADLLETYTNSSYDVVKSVYDNLAAIQSVNTLVGAYFVSATVPTIRPTGDALQLGDRYFNTTSEIIYVYTSSGWKIDGQTTTLVESFSIASADQTVITLTNSYNPNTNNILVYINGVYQPSKSADGTNGVYTETSAYTITFVDPLDEGDLVNVIIGNIYVGESASLTITKLYKIINEGDSLRVVTIPEGVSYIVGSNNLSVYVNGVYQRNYSGNPAYLETNSNTITFTSDLSVNDEIDFVITTF